MFKVGGFYLTLRGYLVKITGEFPFKDGGVLVGGVYVIGNAGWYPCRFKPDGICVNDSGYNIKLNETYENFLTYTRISINFDHVSRTWSGAIMDIGSHTIVALTNIESQERTLKLLQIGAQEKLLSWMRETGYVDDLDEEAS